MALWFDDSVQFEESLESIALPAVEHHDEVQGEPRVEETED
jgi:hypothetical protein